MSPCAEDGITGNWQFAFDLPAPAGTTVSVDATDTVGQATLHLTELQVSPTMIRARIGLDVAGSAVSAWSGLPAVVHHVGVEYQVDSDMAQYVGSAPAGTGQTMFFTTAGSNEVSGTWEIQIPALVYQLSGGEEVSLTGPWTLTVTVP